MYQHLFQREGQREREREREEMRDREIIQGNEHSSMQFVFFLQQNTLNATNKTAMRFIWKLSNANETIIYSKTRDFI